MYGLYRVVRRSLRHAGLKTLLLLLLLNLGAEGLFVLLELYSIKYKCVRINSRNDNEIYPIT